ncbi:hypothetical protein EJD97_001069 [Solanum chilense]|uniref:Uncharacterized protein n=1 Tax=Solanum chilense TaxID=4083 RepID=A0A6N2CKH0_SOLCI|nr:hypothetical protein EJD97_001069 [Solanum chilense]
MVNVTRTKAHDPSHEPIMTTIDRQARDDSRMGRMFGMSQLKLLIGSRLVIEEEMDTSAELYRFIDSAMHMCRMVSGFAKSIDYDDETTDEEDGSTEDDFEATSTGDDALDAT